MLGSWFGGAQPSETSEQRQPGQGGEGAAGDGRAATPPPSRDGCAATPSSRDGPAATPSSQCPPIQEDESDEAHAGLMMNLAEATSTWIRKISGEEPQALQLDLPDTDSDAPQRDVSIMSFGPAGVGATQLQKSKTQRFNRLPNELERKAKELHRDLQSLLRQAGSVDGTQQGSNVEFCVQSSMNVLHHLCMAAELEQCGEVQHTSEQEEEEEERPEEPRDSARIPMPRLSGLSGETDALTGLASPYYTGPNAFRRLDNIGSVEGSLELGADGGSGSQNEEQTPATAVQRQPSKRFSGMKLTLAPTATSMDSLEDSSSRWIDDASRDIGSRRRSFQLFPSEDAPPSDRGGYEVRTSKNTCYLHPERPFRLGWDFCSMLFILLLSVVIPLEVCFFGDRDTPLPLQVFAEFIDVFFMIDIVLNFFTAFHAGHGSSGRLVTDFKGIAKHYAKTWLVIDVVASFPWLRVMQLVGGSADSQAAKNSEAMGMLKVLRYAKVARMMKVLRVLKLGALMQIVEEKMVAAQSMTVAFQLLKMTIAMLIISHNVACGWYAVAIFAEEPNNWLRANQLESADNWKQYVASFYFAITTGTTVGYGDIHPCNTIEQAVTIFVLVLSVGYIGQFLARVSQIVQSLRHLEAQTVQAKRDAMLFMKKRAVPKELQYKVLRYIEHVYETDAVTALDEKVMNILSESLKNQLALAVTGHVLRQFPLFETAEESFLTALCQVVRTERAGVGDAVVHEDLAAHEMFWVVRGEAAVMRRNKQVGGLRTGDWFGEISLFFPGAVRKATVRCETNCEFVVLHHDQFQKTIEEFPKVRRQYEKISAELRKGHPPHDWRFLYEEKEKTSRMLNPMDRMGSPLSTLKAMI